jgi:quinol monooxygenase YgiN
MEHTKMVTMFAKHTVNAYNTWKSAYDDLGATRAKMGVTGAAVYRDPNDKNVLIVTHNFDDLESALAFANSKDLKEAMGHAGVAGRPEFWFGEEIEHTNR